MHADRSLRSGHVVSLPKRRAKETSGRLVERGADRIRRKAGPKLDHHVELLGARVGVAVGIDTETRLTRVPALNGNPVRSRG
jgi:hypothetical protein